MNKDVIKGALIGVVGVSTVASGYYGFIKPNLGIEEPALPTSPTQETTSTQDTSSGNASYKDGKYEGSVVKTRRGDFQVSVDVSGGKITNIAMVTQPTAPQSQEINSSAIPKYVEEAINTQSSGINMISGASETYSGFKGSLQDALNKAK